MGWFILYLIVGILLGFLFRQEDDSFAISNTWLAVLIICAWPSLLLYVAFKVTSLKYKGKILWQRERKS